MGMKDSEEGTGERVGIGIAPVVLMGVLVEGEGAEVSNLLKKKEVEFLALLKLPITALLNPVIVLSSFLL